MGAFFNAGVAVAFAVAAAPAFANDSTAELGTGGLDFVYNENVEMRSEQLFVSTDAVRVTYHFFNKSDQPVINLVAFPMPDVTIADQDTSISVPTEDPVNLLGFSTQANGQPVATKVEQKVFAKGLDRTAMLQGLGVPLAPQLKATYDALDALQKEKWQELIDLGIAEIANYGNTPRQDDGSPRAVLDTEDHLLLDADFPGAAGIGHRAPVQAECWRHRRHRYWQPADP